MTRRDWWAGVAVIAFALLFHAAFPRYIVTAAGSADTATVYRLDRWTGRVERAFGNMWFPIER
jgi:hypothetical protein